MKTSKAIFVMSWMLFSLLSCQSDHHDHAHHGHHDDATHANEHMHKSSFEDLVARFDEPERDAWQKPDEVIAMLGNLSDRTVAEIGAGSGYFTLRIAALAKHTLAIDIDQRFLDLLEARKADLPDPTRFETRLCTEDDPKLQKDEADLVLLVNTYHHIENRTSYFQAVREKLTNAGTLAIIDFKAGEHPVGPPHEIKLSGEEVVEELKKAGYHNIKLDKSTLEYQYIIFAS